MARIVEYDAKDVKLTPSNVGQQAIETGARRVGQFAEQMASGTREVGNLQRDLDDDIGKSLTSMIRFRGLDNSGNEGVKVRGGNGRTLIGTGNAGDDMRWNARANASNANEEGNAPKANKTDNQLDKDKIAAAQKLQAAKDKQASDQAAADLKDAREKEDAQTKADRDQQDMEKNQARTVRDNTSGEVDKDGNPVVVPPADTNKVKLHNALEDTTMDAQIKAQRADEDAAKVQQRNAQDAKIKQATDTQDINKIMLDFAAKKDLLTHATTLSKLAAQAVTSTSPVNTAQQAMSDTDIIRGNRPGASAQQWDTTVGPNGEKTYTRRSDAQQAALNNTNLPKEQEGLPEVGGGTPEGNQKQSGDIPTDIGGGYSDGSIPTWTGDTPAVAGQPPQSGDVTGPPIPGQEFTSPPGGYAQEVPNTPPIYSGIDKPDAPSLYGDMGNGM